MNSHSYNSGVRLAISLIKSRIVEVADGYKILEETQFRITSITSTHIVRFYPIVPTHTFVRRVAILYSFHIRKHL